MKRIRVEATTGATYPRQRHQAHSSILTPTKTSHHPTSTTTKNLTSISNNNPCIKPQPKTHSIRHRKNIKCPENEVRYMKLK